MKHTKHVATVALLLIGVGSLSAQSLGDLARNVRKNKPETASANHHYDNDNLPVNQQLSVVGPPPTSASDAAQAQATGNAAAANPATPADPQKAGEEWQKNIAAQKSKIDALSHELDIDQREYRLKAAAFYGDAGTRLRDSAQFDKDAADHKSNIEQKQKAIDTAQQQLDSLLEQARKAGVSEKIIDAGTAAKDDAGKDK